MKTQLGIESLETRHVFSAYTVEILDTQNLVSQQVENQMRAAADFTMRNLANFVSWKGTLDLRLDVRPPLGNHDGITPAIMSVTPDRRNATVQEMLTGVDPFPNHPDVGMFVHLGKDGTVKLYGMPAYFDPNPMTYVPANVPKGMFDFIGVLNHEVGHGIGFQDGTQEWSRHIIEVGGYRYFNGPETVKALGRPLPMSTFGGTHYGNYLLPDNPVKSGLMYQWGHYGVNRLDFGKLDLAVLRDVGLTTKNDVGLAFTDTNDAYDPRPIMSKTRVYENSPLGTTVGTLRTQWGTDGYSFQLVAGWDSARFKIVGNTVVTNAQFDYESRSIWDPYVVCVRAIDRGGVWNDQLINIWVKDVPETPVLNVPAQLTMVNGFGSLEGLSVTGDRGTIATVVVFSRSGRFESRINDPSLRMSLCVNRTGGMTFGMSGPIEAITRNFRNILYRGNESSLGIQMASGNRNLADTRVSLRHILAVVSDMPTQQKLKVRV